MAGLLAISVFFAGAFDRSAWAQVPAVTANIALGDVGASGAAASVPGFTGPIHVDGNAVAEAQSGTFEFQISDLPNGLSGVAVLDFSTGSSVNTPVFYDMDGLLVDASSVSTPVFYDIDGQLVDANNELDTATDTSIGVAVTVNFAGCYVIIGLSIPAPSLTIGGTPVTLSWPEGATSQQLIRCSEAYTAIVFNDFIVPNDTNDSEYADNGAGFDTGIAGDSSGKALIGEISIDPFNSQNGTVSRYYTSLSDGSLANGETCSSAAFASCLDADTDWASASLKMQATRTGTEALTAEFGGGLQIDYEPSVGTSIEGTAMPVSLVATGGVDVIAAFPKSGDVIAGSGSSFKVWNIYAVLDDSNARARPGVDFAVTGLRLTPTRGNAVTYSYPTDANGPGYLSLDEFAPVSVPTGPVTASIALGDVGASGAAASVPGFTGPIHVDGNAVAEAQSGTFEFQISDLPNGLSGVAVLDFSTGGSVNTPVFYDMDGLPVDASSVNTPVFYDMDGQLVDANNELDTATDTSIGVAVTVNFAGCYVSIGLSIPAPSLTIGGTPVTLSWPEGARSQQLIRCSEAYTAIVFNDFIVPNDTNDSEYADNGAGFDTGIAGDSSGKALIGEISIDPFNSQNGTVSRYYTSLSDGSLANGETCSSAAFASCLDADTDWASASLTVQATRTGTEALTAEFGGGLQIDYEPSVGTSIEGTAMPVSLVATGGVDVIAAFPKSGDVIAGSGSSFKVWNIYAVLDDSNARARPGVDFAVTGLRLTPTRGNAVTYSYPTDANGPGYLSLDGFAPVSVPTGPVTASIALGDIAATDGFTEAIHVADHAVAEAQTGIFEFQITNISNHSAGALALDFPHGVLSGSVSGYSFYESGTTNSVSTIAADTNAVDVAVSVSFAGCNSGTYYLSIPAPVLTITPDTGAATTVQVVWQHETVGRRPHDTLMNRLITCGEAYHVIVNSGGVDSYSQYATDGSGFDTTLGDETGKAEIGKVNISFNTYNIHGPYQYYDVPVSQYYTSLADGPLAAGETCSAATTVTCFDGSSVEVSLSIDVTSDGSAAFNGGLQIGTGDVSPLTIAEGATGSASVEVALHAGKGRPLRYIYSPIYLRLADGTFGDGNERSRPGLTFVATSLKLTQIGAAAPISHPVNYDNPARTLDSFAAQPFDPVGPTASIDFGDLTDFTGFTGPIYVERNIVRPALDVADRTGSFEFQLTNIHGHSAGALALNFTADGVTGGSVVRSSFYESGTNNPVSTIGADTNAVDVVVTVGFDGCYHTPGLSPPAPTLMIDGTEVALTGWPSGNLITCGNAYSVFVRPDGGDSEYATDGSGFDRKVMGDSISQALIGTVRIGDFNDHGDASLRYYTTLMGSPLATGETCSTAAADRASCLDASTILSSASLKVRAVRTDNSTASFVGKLQLGDSGTGVAITLDEADPYVTASVSAPASPLPIYATLEDAGTARARPGVRILVKKLELTPTTGADAITYNYYFRYLDGFAPVSAPPTGPLTASIALGEIAGVTGFTGPIHVDRTAVNSAQTGTFEFVISGFSDTNLSGTPALSFGTVTGGSIIDTATTKITFHDAGGTEATSISTAGSVRVSVPVVFDGCSDTVTGFSIPAPSLTIGDAPVALSWPRTATSQQLITCGDAYNVTVASDASDSEYAADGSGFDTTVGDEAGKARIGTLTAAFNSQSGTVWRYYTTLAGAEANYIDASTRLSAASLTVQATRTDSLTASFGGKLQLGDSGTGNAVAGIDLAATPVTVSVTGATSPIPIYAVLDDAGTDRDRPGVAFAVTGLSLTPTGGTAITYSYAAASVSLDEFAPVLPSTGPVTASIALGDIVGVTGFTGPIHVDSNAVNSAQTGIFEFVISGFSDTNLSGTPALSFGTVNGVSINDTAITFHNAGGTVATSISTAGSVRVSVPVAFDGCGDSDNDPDTPVVTGLSVSAPTFTIGGTDVTLSWPAGTATNADGTLQLITCGDAYNVTVASDASDSEYAADGSGFDTTVGDSISQALIGTLTAAFNSQDGQGYPVWRYYTSLAGAEANYIDASTRLSAASLTVEATRTDSSTASFDGKLQLGDSGTGVAIGLAATPVTVSVSSTITTFTSPLSIYAVLDYVDVVRDHPGVAFAVTGLSLTPEGGTAIAYDPASAALDGFAEHSVPTGPTANIALGDVTGVNGFTEAIHVDRTKLTSALLPTSRTGIFEFVISGFSDTSLSGAPALSFGTVTGGSIIDTAITFHNAGGTEATSISSADTVRVSVPVSFDGCSDTVTDFSLPAPSFTIGGKDVTLSWPVAAASQQLIGCGKPYGVSVASDEGAGNSQYAADGSGFDTTVVGDSISKAQIGTVSIGGFNSQSGTVSRYYTSLSSVAGSGYIDANTSLSLNVSMTSDGSAEFVGGLQIGDGTSSAFNIGQTGGTTPVEVALPAGTRTDLPIYLSLAADTFGAGNERDRPGLSFKVTGFKLIQIGADASISYPVIYSWGLLEHKGNGAHGPVTLDGFAAQPFDPTAVTASIALGDIVGVTGFTETIHVAKNVVTSALPSTSRTAKFEFLISGFSATNLSGTPALSFGTVTGGSIIDTATTKITFHNAGGTEATSISTAATVRVSVPVSFNGCSDTVTGLSLPAPTFRIGAAPVAFTGWPSGKFITCTDAYSVRSDVDESGADMGNSEYAADGDGFNLPVIGGRRKTLIGTISINNTALRYYTSLAGRSLVGNERCGVIDADRATCLDRKTSWSASLKVQVSRPDSSTDSFDGKLKLGHRGSAVAINLDTTNVVTVSGDATDFVVFIDDDGVNSGHVSEFSLSIYAVLDYNINPRARPGVNFAATELILTPTGGDAITYSYADAYVPLDGFLAIPDPTGPVTAEIGFGDLAGFTGFNEAIHVDSHAVSSTSPADRTALFEFQLTNISGHSGGTLALDFPAGVTGGSVSSSIFYESGTNNPSASIAAGTNAVDLVVSVSFDGCDNVPTRSSAPIGFSLPAPRLTINDTPVVLTGWQENLIACGEAYRVTVANDTNLSRYTDSEYATGGRGFDATVFGDSIGQAQIGKVSIGDFDSKSGTVSRYYTSLTGGSLAIGESCSSAAADRASCLDANTSLDASLTVRAVRTDNSTASFGGKLQLGDSGTGVAINLAATPVTVTVSGTITSPISSPIPIYATLDDAGTAHRPRPGVAFAVTELILTPTGGDAIAYDKASVSLDGFELQPSATANMAFGDIATVTGFTGPIHVDSHAVAETQIGIFEFKITNIPGHSGGALALDFSDGVSGGSVSGYSFYESGTNNPGASIAAGTNVVDVAVSVSFAGCNRSFGLEILPPSLTITPISGGAATTVQLSWPETVIYQKLITCGEAYHVTVDSDADDSYSQYATDGSGFDTARGDEAGKAKIGTVRISSFNTYNNYSPSPHYGVPVSQYYTSLTGGPLAAGETCSAATTAICFDASPVEVSISIDVTSDGFAEFAGDLQIGTGDVFPLTIAEGVTGSASVDVTTVAGIDLPIYLSLADGTFGAGNERSRPGLTFAATNLKLTQIGVAAPISYPIIDSYRLPAILDGFDAQPFDPAGPTASIDFGDIMVKDGFTGPIHVDSTAVNSRQWQSGIFEFKITNISNHSGGALALNFTGVTGGYVYSPIYNPIYGSVFYESGTNNPVSTIGADTNAVDVVLRVDFYGCGSKGTVTSLSVPAPSLTIGDTPAALTGWPSGNLITCGEAYVARSDVDVSTGDSEYADNGYGFIEAGGDIVDRAKIGEISFNSQSGTVSRYYTSLTGSLLATGETCSTAAADRASCLDASTNLDTASLTVRVSRTDSSTDSFVGKLQLGDSGTGVAINLDAADPSVTASVSAPASPLPIYATLDDAGTARARPGVKFMVTELILTPTGGDAITYSYSFRYLDGFLAVSPPPTGPLTASIALGDIAAVNGFNEAIHVDSNAVNSAQTGIFEFLISGFSATNLSGTPALSFGTVTGGSIIDTAITFYDAGGTVADSISTAGSVHVSVPVSFNGCDTASGLSIPAPVLTIDDTDVTLTDWPSGNLITCGEAYSVTVYRDGGDSEYAYGGAGFDTTVSDLANKANIGMVRLGDFNSQSGTVSRYYTTLTGGSLATGQCSTTCLDADSNWSSAELTMEATRTGPLTDSFDGKLQLGETGTGVAIGLAATPVTVSISSTITTFTSPIPIYATLDDITSRDRPGVDFAVTELSLTPTGGTAIAYDPASAQLNRLDRFVFQPSATAVISFDDIAATDGFTGPIFVEEDTVAEAQSGIFEFKVTNIPGHSGGALALDFSDGVSAGVSGGSVSGSSFYVAGSADSVSTIGADTNAVAVAVTVSFDGCNNATGLGMKAPVLTITPISGGAATTVRLVWGDEIASQRPYSRGYARMIDCSWVYSGGATSDVGVSNSEYTTDGSGFAATVGDSSGKAQIGEVVILVDDLVSRYYSSLANSGANYMDVTTAVVSFSIDVTSDGSAAFDGGLQIGDGATSALNIGQTGGITSVDVVLPADISAGNLVYLPIYLSLAADTFGAGNERSRPGLSFEVTGFKLTPPVGDPLNYPVDGAPVALDGFGAVSVPPEVTAEIGFGDLAGFTGFNEAIHVDSNAVNSAQTATFEFKITNIPGHSGGALALDFSAGVSGGSVSGSSFYVAGTSNLTDNINAGAGAMDVVVTVVFGGCSDTVTGLSLPAPSLRIGSTSVTLSGWHSGNFITCGEAYSVTVDADARGVARANDSKYATDGSGFDTTVVSDEAGKARIGKVDISFNDQSGTVSRYYTSLSSVADSGYIDANTSLSLTIGAASDGSAAFDGGLQVGDGTSSALNIGQIGQSTSVDVVLPAGTGTDLPIYLSLAADTFGAGNERDRPGLNFGVTGLKLTPTGAVAPISYPVDGTRFALDGFVARPVGVLASIALGDIAAVNGFTEPIHVESTAVNSAQDGIFEFVISDFADPGVSGTPALSFGTVTGGSIIDTAITFYDAGGTEATSISTAGSVHVSVPVSFNGCDTASGLSIPAPVLTIDDTDVTLTGWPSGNLITCGDAVRLVSDTDYMDGTPGGDSEYSPDGGFDIAVAGPTVDNVDFTQVGNDGPDADGRHIASVGVLSLLPGYYADLQSMSLLEAPDGLSLEIAAIGGTSNIAGTAIYDGESGTGWGNVVEFVDGVAILGPANGLAIGTIPELIIGLVLENGDLAVRPALNLSASVKHNAQDIVTGIALDGFKEIDENSGIVLPGDEISGGIIAGANINVSAATADQPALYIATDALVTAEMAQDFYQSFTADLAAGAYTLRVDLAGGSFVGNAGAARFADGSVGGSVYATVKIGDAASVRASGYVSSVASRVDISFTTDAAGEAVFELLLPVQFAGCVSTASELRATVSFVAVPGGSVAPDAIERQFIGCARAYALSGNSGSDTGWGGGESQYVENGSGFDIGVFGPVLNNFRLPADTADKAAIGVVELSFNPDNIATDVFYLDIGDDKKTLSGAAGEVVVKVTASDPAGLAGVSFDDTPGDVADFTDGVAELPINPDQNKMFRDAIYLSLDTTPMRVRPAAMFSGEVIIAATGTAIAGSAMSFDSFAEDGFAICGEFDWIGDSGRMARNYIRISGLTGFVSIEAMMQNFAGEVEPSVTDWQVLEPVEFGFSLGDDVIVIRAWELEKVFGVFLRGDVSFRINGVPASKVDCDRLIRSSPSYAVSSFGNNGGDNMALDGDD